MFSGLVEYEGKVCSLKEHDELRRFSIQLPAPVKDWQLGESIAVNGVCLTVVDFNEDTFSVEVVPETLRCTNLGQLVVGDSVNLERSVTPTQRIGGHFVQGHVDTTTRILSIKNEGAAWWVIFSLPDFLRPYIVKKGFVAIDGMSLTIADLNRDSFAITFIPHTQLVTIVKNYQEGQRVNIEVDMLAKYVEKILESKKNDSD